MGILRFCTLLGLGFVAFHFFALPQDAFAQITKCTDADTCVLSCPTGTQTRGPCKGYTKENPVVCCTKPEEAAATVTSSVANVGKPSTRPLTLPDPLGGADLPRVIGRVISTFLGMVGALALLVFVYAGTRYMTAAGSEDAIKTAKDTMKFALIGLAIIIFAYVITDFYFKALLSK